MIAARNLPSQPESPSPPGGGELSRQERPCAFRKSQVQGTMAGRHPSGQGPGSGAGSDFVGLLWAFLQPRDEAARALAHDALVAMVDDGSSKGAAAQSLALLSALAAVPAKNAEASGLAVFASQLVLQSARQQTLNEMLPLLVHPPKSLPSACRDTLILAAAVVCCSRGLPVVQAVQNFSTEDQVTFIASLSVDGLDAKTVEALLQVLNGPYSADKVMACIHLEATLFQVKTFAPKLLQEMLHRASLCGDGADDDYGDEVANLGVFETLSRGGPSDPSEHAELVQRLSGSLLPSLALNHALVPPTSSLCLCKIARAAQVDQDQDALDFWLDPPDHLEIDESVARALVQACLYVDDDDALWAREALLAFVDAWPQFTSGVFSLLGSTTSRSLLLLGAMARREDLLSEREWVVAANALISSGSLSPSLLLTGGDFAYWCSQSLQVLGPVLNLLTNGLSLYPREASRALLEVASALGRKNKPALAMWKAVVPGSVNSAALLPNHPALVHALVIMDSSLAKQLALELQRPSGNTLVAERLQGLAHCVNAEPLCLSEVWAQAVSWFERGHAVKVCTLLLANIPPRAWEIVGPQGCKSAVELCVRAASLAAAESTVRGNTSDSFRCLRATLGPLLAMPELVGNVLSMVRYWEDTALQFRVARIGAEGAGLIAADVVETALRQVEAGRPSKETWDYLQAILAIVGDEQQGAMLVRIALAAAAKGPWKRAAKLLEKSDGQAAVRQIRVLLGETSWARLLRGE